MKIKIKTIPQDTEHHRSFNVLVPQEIQGKEGELLMGYKRPTPQRGSQSAHVLVDGKAYSVPGWALEPA